MNNPTGVVGGVICCFLLLRTTTTGYPIVTIFNAYPRRALAALITFGTKKYYKEVVHYGEFKKFPLISNNYDYIIEYLEPPKAAPIPELTTYGYLTGFDEDDIQDSLIVITKDTQGNVKDTSILFEKVNDGLSRVYFFNAMKKVENLEKGVYAYCLYDRQNYGGDTSKSILQLANDVPYNRGVETVLLANAMITIKVFDRVIHSVDDFNQIASLHNNSVNVQMKGNQYNFIILFGTQKNITNPPYLSSREDTWKKSSTISKLAYGNYICLILMLFCQYL